MAPRTLLPIAVLAIGLAFSAVAGAQALYAASVRSLAGGGEDTRIGSLYVVALATGTPSFVAPIRIAGSGAIGLTGIAVHPLTGVFYGITSPLSQTNAQSLVTFDPSTGNARLIGALRQAGSDIAFNRAGHLFAWVNGSSQLAYVDPASGLLTPIGEPGPPGPPAGLAIDAHGVGYVTPSGAGGALEMVDLGTGRRTRGPPLSGAPFPSAINSMTFTPSGLLLAVNSNAGNPANTRLVTINVATGAVAEIGTLPDDTDGLAFANVAAAEEGVLFGMGGQSLALIGLAFVALILGLVGWAVGRKPAQGATK